MSKEFIKENNIAQVRYSNQYECIADRSKETRSFLDSTPCLKAKVLGSFLVVRKTKRGHIYVVIRCSDYDIDYECFNLESDELYAIPKISSLFNPEVAEACKLIDNSNRLNLSIRELRKIYKNAISRARNIDKIDRCTEDDLYNFIIPSFSNKKSSRTKVFLTPNLRSKIGG